MAQFLLLLHEGPELFAGYGPEEIERIIGEYFAWRDRLEAEHRFVGSNKLADDPGRSLVAEGGGVRVVDGPFAESKELIGGYFLITASDYDDAVEVGRSCPHLRHGGRIEVRQVDLEHHPEGEPS